LGKNVIAKEGGEGPGKKRHVNVCWGETKGQKPGPRPRVKSNGSRRGGTPQQKEKEGLKENVGGSDTKDQ